MKGTTRGTGTVNPSGTPEFDDFNLTNKNPWFSSFFVSRSAQGNPDRNHKHWNIASNKSLTNYIG